MRLSRHISLCSIIALATLLVVGCSSDNHHRRIDVAALEQRLEPGDLVFRRGTGVVGHIVTSVDSRGEYSHVGIAICKNGKWHVVHAVPYEPEFEGDYDRVKCESLEAFVAHYPKAAIGHYRVAAERAIRTKAADNALRISNEGRRFDHAYNLEDSTEFYCTELVEYLYSLSGLRLSEGRRTVVNFPSLSGEYIMPSDITESELVIPIY